MKYEKRAAGIFLSIAVAVSVLTSDSLSASQPGTSADPLVSKSYVDGKIADALNQAGSGGAASSMDIDGIVTDVVAQIEFLYGDVLQNNPQQNNTTPSPQPEIAAAPADKYVPVRASYGQIIIGEEGCEIILRSGTAKVYSSASNGLVDATYGAELFHEDEAQKNHILIVPRDDGRGVIITAPEAWFIIKGQYEILG